MDAEKLSLLLVRPNDLFIAAISVAGFDLADGAVRLRAESRIEVILPPQSTGEVAYRPEISRTVAARLSGPSRLTFVLPSDTTVPLTVSGILTVLRSAELDLTDGAWPENPLSLELPWRLWLAPRPATKGDTLRTSLPVGELFGRSGAVGLWHARLEAAGGLEMVPLHVGEDGDIDPPLNRGRRDRIYGEGGSRYPPRAPFVDLSPLGGTLSVAGEWPTFLWRQEIVLGRDMAVRTEAKGFLYPYGHPAVLVESANRVLTGENGTATAGLEEHRTLIILDPIRRRAAHGPLARWFPFDEVEVLERVLHLGGEEIPERFKRTPKRLQPLIDALEAKRRLVADKTAALGALFDQRRNDIVAGGESLKGEVNQELDPIWNRIREIEEMEAQYQEWVATHPVHEPPPVDPVFDDGDPDTVVVQPYRPPDPSDQPPPRPDLRELARLREEAQRLQGRLDGIDAATQQALAGVGTEDDLLAAGGGYAAAVIDLRDLRDRQLPEDEAKVAAVRKEADQEHDVYLWPLDRTGRRLRIPVRCDDLHLSTPVIFVHDIDLPEDDDFPRFAPLADPDSEVPIRITAAWQGYEERRVALPGIPIDLVRAGDQPQAQDVLAVHELTITGAPAAVGFRPVLEEARVVLPAVAELVPGQDGTTRVAYHNDYISTGDAEHVALELLDPIPINFARVADEAVADKAGALIAPVCTATVLARKHGPVAANALPGYRPLNLTEAFAGATILGIPLASVVDAEHLPSPLEIVPVPGGVRMSWVGIPLKSHGPLRVEAGTTCRMTVVRSVAETRTECRIERFSLVIPPGLGDLVQLRFGALTFTQVPGRPPDLQVENPSVVLGGDLGLLKTLGDIAKLADQTPTVRSTPTGMSVSYRFAVPSAQAGVFVMQNIAVGVDIEVPFDGGPIVTTLAFASREDPFMLTVYAFGGGGYLVFEIGETGIRRLEASLDFGAMVAIGIGIASAEAHALGGVRFLLAGGDVLVTGFVRIGGSIDILGLVSVSVELRVELTYDERQLLPDGSANNHYGALVGRATLVIEIDITFWSGAIELDSGEYVLAGGMANPATIPPSTAYTAQPTPPEWQAYREAYRR